MLKHNPVIARSAMEVLEDRRLLASVAATTPYNGQEAVSLSANLTVRFGSAMTASSLTSSTVQLLDASGNPVATSLSYNASNTTLTIDPVSNLVNSGVNNFYTLRVVGGASGVKDSGNGILATDYKAFFTTGTTSLTETSIFTGLTQPTAIEFADNGKIFVAEKRGIIKVFDSITDTSPDIFADLRTKVHNYWDRGLLGLALDPQFTTGRPYIYVMYTFDGDINGNAPKWGSVNGDSDPGASNGTGTVAGVISRLTASGNAMTGNELVLVKDFQNQYPSHSIGDLKFGPDGYLYASAGDGASFNAIDYGQSNVFGDPTNEGGALRSQDIRSTGDATGLDGTVIRIDPDTGAAAPSNPFASSADVNNKRIIAYGLRNPFRLTFRPGTSELWIGETGWNSYEEINRIPNASDTVAENFGWPAYEGPDRNSVYDAQNLPLLESLYSQGTGAVAMPWFAYAHSAQVVSGSSEPTGGSTPTGLMFYTGTAMPAAYQDAFFFTDYARKQIYVMYRGADGNPDQSTRRIFRTLGSGAVELQQGPDGGIYYVDHLGGRVVRLMAGQSTGSTGSKLTGTPIGAANSGSNTPAMAFDGNQSTYYESSAASGGWVGLDLGAARWVKQLRFSPRTSFASRMVGGIFQGSNDPSFASGVVNLHTIASTPNAGLQTVNVNASGANFRYIRYVSPANGYTNIAEMEIYAGDGLNATYYNNIDFTGSTVTRVDSNINFNWGTGSPDSSIAADTFSARWTGKVQAVESGTYTFQLTGDDGIRLWVNNVLLIDKLIDQSATTYTNTINLTAGQLYDIRVDYYENGGDAAVNLQWQRPGNVMVVIPTSNLFTASPSANQPPVPTIDSPTSTLKWKVGDTINFSGGATDPETGALPASALTWSLVLIHANDINLSSTHEHLVQTWSGVSSGSFIAPDHEYPSWLELRLTATDSNNQTTTISRRVDPLTISLTLASNPTGASLTYGSSVGNAPVTHTIIAGSLSTISAPAQIVSGGQTYIFTGWSDGGAITHDIIAPSVNTTLTANYALPAVPTAPSGLVATSISTSQINLVWLDNASNETGYKIERRIGTGAWSEIFVTGANITSYSNIGLAQNTTYEYRIRATGAGGDSAYSASASATTASSITTPSAPTSLAASSITTSTLTLSWTDNANNETSFILERRLLGGGYSVIATLAANTTSYADSGLTAGASYEYRVRASNSAGDSAVSNTLGVTMQTGSTTPASPTGLSATVLAGPQVQLTWTDASNNETGFTIQRRYAGWIWGDIGTAAANATSFLDTTSIGSVTYEYRIIATNALGNSGFSNSVLVDTSITGAVPPATPANLAASAASSTRINLTWEDIATDETGYKIDRRLAGGAWAQIAAIAANSESYADTTVVAGNTYEYRVRATRNTVDGAYSNSASATTPGGATGLPDAPSGLSAVVTTKPNVQLTWVDNADNETSFVIQRRYTGWIWGDVGTVGANTTTFTDTSGINNVTYEYRVVARNGTGSSPFSNSVIVSTV